MKERRLRILMGYINKSLEKNLLAPLGPNIGEFEEAICKYVGVKHTRALVSGSSAIHLGLKGLGVKEGDVVFCSSLTFSSSAIPIIHQGAEPIFIDSSYETWNMCPIALEKAFKDAKKCNKMPKVVVVANLYGQSADYDKLKAICNKYKVPILEDASESLGATYKGKQCGTIGDMGVFSFDENNIITTSGGGMLVSNNAKYSKKAFSHKDSGFNYRMSNAVAGIGRGQMKFLNDRIAKKKGIYELYKKAFKDIEFIDMMNICDFGDSNYLSSVITIKEGYTTMQPIDIVLALEEENIEAKLVCKPLHIQPLFKKYKFFTASRNISVAEDLFNRGLCLPSDVKMSLQDISRVIDIIRNLALQYGR